jgi:Ulp1 family protease
MVQQYKGSEKVLWGVMKNLLNKKEGQEKNNKDKWVNDEIVNYYCHNYLGKEDIKRCEHHPGRKRSHFSISYFCQNFLYTRSNDLSMFGKYNLEMVKRWHTKVPRKDIFKLKIIFIPINSNDNHWTCIVMYIAEK